MKDKRMWFVCALSLMMVVMASSVFTVVYSASNGASSNLNHFNFLMSAQTSGKIVTTDIDNSINDTAYQTMKINDKYAYLPAASALLSDIEMGEGVASDIVFKLPSTNFVVIPVRITNNMTNESKVVLQFTNISSSPLKQATQYEVYNYATKQYSNVNRLTDEYAMPGTLLRGEFVDICVVVHIEDLSKVEYKTKDILYFNFAVSMSAV